MEEGTSYISDMARKGMRRKVSSTSRRRYRAEVMQNAKKMEGGKIVGKRQNEALLYVYSMLAAFA